MFLGLELQGFVLVALGRVRALELTQKPPLVEVRAVLFWSRLLETLGGLPGRVRTWLFLDSLYPELLLVSQRDRLTRNS